MKVTKQSDGTSLMYIEEFVEVGDIVPSKDGELYMVGEIVNDMTSRTVTKAMKLMLGPNIEQ